MAERGTVLELGPVGELRQLDHCRCRLLAIPDEGVLAALGGRRTAAELSHAHQAHVEVDAALEVATVQMATELSKLLARAGQNASTHILVPFGGAGPMHAAMLAEEARLAGIVMPPAAAVFCAVGAAMSDARREFVRALRGRTILDVADELWQGSVRP